MWRMESGLNAYYLRAGCRNVDYAIDHRKGWREYSDLGASLSAGELKQSMAPDAYVRNEMVAPAEPPDAGRIRGEKPPTRGSLPDRLLAFSLDLRR